jgi:hypothetical protein
MRVAYLGNFVPEFSTENDVRKAFEYLGWEVVTLQENRTNIQTIKGMALKSDLFLVTGTWDSIPLPDMLDLYHDCAVKGIPTATLHLDTFWSTARHGRKWWREAMFHTAYLFTADGDYQDEWKAFGKNHIWLPPAVRHDAAHFGKFREEYACDVAFVGSNGHGYHEDVWSYRRELVDNLRAMCNRNGWSFKNPGGDQPRISRGEDMNDFYASAKVTVGDSLCLKREKSHYFSDRQAEVWSRGGFAIMPQIDCLTEFSGGLTPPMYAWGDFDGLEDIIKKYLEDEVERKNIVNKMQLYYKENNTYVNRVKTLLEHTNLL